MNTVLILCLVNVECPDVLVDSICIHFILSIY